VGGPCYNTVIPMPRTTLTTYECEHDLLPAVCARCGAPAAERVGRPLPVPPGCRTAAWVLPLFLVVYLAVPAVLALLPCFSRRLRHTEVRVPVCAADRDHWGWRDLVRRRALWPLVFVAALAVQAACLAGLILHPALYAHAAAGVVMVGFVIDWATLARGEVVVHRAGPAGVYLSGVHPDFVAALIEDRARDRVDHPDRRTLRGDLRDDFDDEPA
jgi:hypothetical protein